MYILVVSIRHHQQSLTISECSSYTTGYSVVIIRFDTQFVHNHFNIVVAIAVYSHFWCQFTYFAIYTGMQETFFANTLKEFPVMSLTVAHQGCQQINPLVGIAINNQLYNLLFCKAHHLFPCFIRNSISDSCIKQTKEILDFSNSPDCRARISISCFLVNTDYWTQSCNLVYVRSL